MERLRSGEHVYDGCSCQRGGRCHGNGRITTLPLMLYLPDFYLIFYYVFDKQHICTCFHGDSAVIYSY